MPDQQQPSFDPKEVFTMGQNLVGQSIALLEVESRAVPQGGDRIDRKVTVTIRKTGVMQTEYYVFDEEGELLTFYTIPLRVSTQEQQKAAINNREIQSHQQNIQQPPQTAQPQPNR